MRILSNVFLLLLTMCCSKLVMATEGGKAGKKCAEGSVNGYVTDAITKKPVSGIKVTVSTAKQPVPKELQSDGTGHFSIGKLPVGEVVLLLEKKGYKLFKSDVLYIKEGGTTSISITISPLPEEDGGNEIWNPLYKFIDTITPFE